MAASSKGLFELFYGVAELSEAFFEDIAEKRHAQKIFGRSSVIGAGGFGPNVVPIIQLAVTTSEPGEGDQVDLLVLIQSADDRGQLGSNRVVAVIFQDRQHSIVAGVGARPRVGDDVLAVKLPRFRNDR